MEKRNPNPASSGSVPPPGRGAGGLWAVYYGRGYEDGHRQAIRDALQELVRVSEEFLTDWADPAVDPHAARKLVYSLERQLERRIDEVGRDHGAAGADGEVE